MAAGVGRRRRVDGTRGAGELGVVVAAGRGHRSRAVGQDGGRRSVPGAGDRAPAGGAHRRVLVRGSALRVGGATPPRCSSVGIHRRPLHRVRPFPLRRDHGDGAPGRRRPPRPVARPARHRQDDGHPGPGPELVRVVRDDLRGRPRALPGQRPLPAVGSARVHRRQRRRRGHRAQVAAAGAGGRRRAAPLRRQEGNGPGPVPPAQCGRRFPRPGRAGVGAHHHQRAPRSPPPGGHPPRPVPGRGGVRPPHHGREPRLPGVGGIRGRTGRRGRPHPGRAVRAPGRRGPGLDRRPPGGAVSTCRHSRRRPTGERADRPPSAAESPPTWRGSAEPRW